MVRSRAGGAAGWARTREGTVDRDRRGGGRRKRAANHTALPDLRDPGRVTSDREVQPAHRHPPAPAMSSLYTTAAVRLPPDPSAKSDCQRHPIEHHNFTPNRHEHRPSG